jgi:hypothetical protein
MTENPKEEVEGKENEATQPQSQRNAVTGSTDLLKNKCKCSARRRPKTESGEEIHISNCPEYPKVSDYPQEDVEKRQIKPDIVVGLPERTERD